MFPIKYFLFSDSYYTFASQYQADLFIVQPVKKTELINAKETSLKFFNVYSSVIDSMDSRHILPGFRMILLDEHPTNALSFNKRYEKQEEYPGGTEQAHPDYRRRHGDDDPTVQT